MWNHEDLLDIFRGNFPYYLLIAFPILLLLSPVPVNSSVEFAVFRLQQYELHGTSYGSQSSLVTYEARTLDSGSVTRKCVIARIMELSPAVYQQLINEGASALLILLPPSFAALDYEKKKIVWDLEEMLVDTEVQMAVYLAYENEDLTIVYKSIQSFTNTDSASSAAAAFLTSLSSDGYQMVASGGQSKKIPDMTISNIYGRLVGYGVEEQLPTIAIVAHYDAFAAAPELAYGADSNGSGVVALLEIARILSKLYSSLKTHPKVNIVFLLSGGGSINYQGSKRFLEDQLDASDSPLLSEPQFALCLDTLANGPKLYLHVSKKPRDDSPGQKFYESLEEAGESFGVPVEMVHKKINLQEEKQSWEHEKFSIRRLPAFTLSRLTSPKTGERGVLTDTFESLDAKNLRLHTSVVLTALLKHIYNRSVDGLLDGGFAISEESVNSWLTLLNQPRSLQSLTGKNNPLVTSLHQVLSRYSTEGKISPNRADRRDPEWAFYDMTRTSMNAYSVKPAVFDFFMTIVVCGYLGIVYVFLQYFPAFYVLLKRLSTSAHQRVKTH